MNNPAKRNRAIVVLLLFSFSIMGGATEPIKQQTWSFQGQTGIVKIRASVYERDSDHKPSTALELWVESGRSGINEEGHFISDVLTDFPRSGFDTSSISILLFRLDQTDAEKRVAPFAAKSRKWNSVARSGLPRVMYPRVTEMLNDSEAFKEWFDLFRANGLDAQVAGIEKLGMMRFRETGATCPAGANCSRVLVPATAQVQVNLQPIHQN